MKRFWILGIAVFAADASAVISYEVDVQPDASNLHVTMRIPSTSKGSSFQLPSWAPGAYIVRDTSASVKNLKATDATGAVLEIKPVTEVIKKSYQDGAETKVSERNLVTWQVAPAKSTILTYDIDLRPNDGSMHWSGPSTYLYEVNRKREKCLLTIRVPTGWPVFTGLDETKPGGFEYTAKDYDVLADNPVSAGNVLVDTYVSRGKPHFIVMRNPAKSDVDRAKLRDACKMVTDSLTDFMGGAPYSKYVWHFAVNNAPDGAGGLEHLSSTQISLASGVGPRAVSVLAHEFFHLWNVKRIRSRPLGPFDYTRLPETGALWWLEGTTDYYAHSLLHRYGAVDETGYLADINSNYQQVARNPAFKEIGPEEASRRVGEASSGRGNSNGYRISYYNLGWLAGMCLDIEIRNATQNRRSLDDVLRSLWQLCRDDRPGFPEDEIRRQCIKFGGPSLGPIYDRIVMQGDMPVSSALAKVGLAITTKTETYPDPGFSWGGRGQTSLTVSQVRGSAIGKLAVGDVVVEVNGKPVVGTNGREMGQWMTEAMRGIAVASPILLKVKRQEAELDVEIVPTQGQRVLTQVAASPNATEAEKALRAAWMAPRKGKL